MRNVRANTELGQWQQLVQCFRQQWLSRDWANNDTNNYQTDTPNPSTMRPLDNNGADQQTVAEPRENIAPTDSADQFSFVAPDEQGLSTISMATSSMMPGFVPESIQVSNSMQFDYFAVDANDQSGQPRSQNLSQPFSRLISARSKSDRVGLIATHQSHSMLRVSEAASVQMFSSSLARPMETNSTYESFVPQLTAMKDSVSDAGVRETVSIELSEEVNKRRRATLDQLEQRDASAELQKHSTFEVSDFSNQPAVRVDLDEESPVVDRVGITPIVQSSVFFAVLSGFRFTKKFASDELSGKQGLRISVLCGMRNAMTSEFSWHLPQHLEHGFLS